jgi:hypothetical protein
VASVVRRSWSIDGPDIDATPSGRHTHSSMSTATIIIITD